MNTSPISGMQEFLPGKQAIFNEIKTKIADTYKKHGFLNIETPTIDRTDILFAKAGGDTEKQIYRVYKTEETAKDADQALRFDHTVPLARYVVEHESDLHFPFSVTQIGRNFRGERAQKGRFREFYQCDVDVIGRNTLPIYYDAKVIACFYDALKSFVKTNVKIRISNRKFLTGALEILGVEDKAAEISHIIDHAEKVPEEKTVSALKELKISEENVVNITTFMNVHGDIRELEKIDFLKINIAAKKSDAKNDTLSEGLSELITVMEDLKAYGLGDAATIDLKIVRGLDYYTGTVFEACLPDYPELGSIGGGGRYENLASHYTDQKFPGVGASIGLSRLFFILSENNLIDSAEKKPIDIAIVPIDADDIELRTAAYNLARELRENGKFVEIVLSGKKLGDKITYATKIAGSGIIFGGDELKSKKYQIKNFATGKQEQITFNDK